MRKALQDRVEIACIAQIYKPSTLSNNNTIDQQQHIEIINKQDKGINKRALTIPEGAASGGEVAGVAEIRFLEDELFVNNQERSQTGSGFRTSGGATAVTRDENTGPN